MKAHMRSVSLKGGPEMDQILVLLAAAGVSLTVAGITWFAALRWANKMRHDARLRERKRVLYGEVLKLQADIFANEKTSKSQKKDTAYFVRQYMGSSKFRLMQLELNMIAPDDVVQSLSWHGRGLHLTEEEQGTAAMYFIGKMLIAIRRDMYGKKTRLDHLDMFRIFVDDEAHQLLRSQWSDLESKLRQINE